MRAHRDASTQHPPRDRVSWEVALGRLLLQWHVARALRSLPSPSGGPPPEDHPNPYGVAAVQWQAEPVKRMDQWVNRATAFARDARALGAQLLVFPEDAGLPLLGVLERYVGRRAATTQDAVAVGRRLRGWAPVLERLQWATMQRLAVQFGLVVVGGSSLAEDDDGRVVNRVAVFGPDGRCRQTQAKLHLLDLERSWGLSPGTEWRPPVEGSPRIAAVVCHDASYFETYRMAAADGVEIVAVPIADPDPDYAEAKARRGAWARSQETGLPSVVAAMTGELFGVALTGKAGIYVPRALTPDGSGVVAESADPVGSGLVVGALDLVRLREWRDTVMAPVRDAGYRWLVPRYLALTQGHRTEGATVQRAMVGRRDIDSVNASG